MMLDRGYIALTSYSVSYLLGNITGSRPYNISLKILGTEVILSS